MINIRIIKYLETIIVSLISMPLIIATFLFVKREKRKEFLNGWFDILNV